MIPPCLTLCNIRYVSRAKWSNSGKEVAPSPTLWCSSYWKGSILVALDYGRRLTFIDKMWFVKYALCLSILLCVCLCVCICLCMFMSVCVCVSETVKFWLNPGILFYERGNDMLYRLNFIVRVEWFFLHFHTISQLTMNDSVGYGRTLKLWLKMINRNKTKKKHSQLAVIRHLPKSVFHRNIRDKLGYLSISPRWVLKHLATHNWFYATFREEEKNEKRLGC